MDVRKYRFVASKAGSGIFESHIFETSPDVLSQRHNKSSCNLKTGSQKKNGLTFTFLNFPYAMFYFIFDINWT